MHPLHRLVRRLRGPASPEDATLQELVDAFCDPRKAQRLERRWARATAYRGGGTGGPAS